MSGIENAWMGGMDRWRGEKTTLSFTPVSKEQETVAIVGTDSPELEQVYVIISACGNQRYLLCIKYETDAWFISGLDKDKESRTYLEY